MTGLAPVDHLRLKVEQLRGAREVAVQAVSETRKAIKTLDGEMELLDLVQGAFRTLIDREVTEGVKAVERLLTEGLQAVFTDQDLSVESEVVISRGKVSVDLLTVQKRPDGVVIRGMPNDAFGGAVATVQSVLLRIIVMRRRGLRSLLLLDESLPAFDANYVHNMGAFLSLICDRLGLDILLVSHNPALIDASDHAYRIARTKAGAKFERMR